MSDNVVINRSPSTEEAQDAVGAALQAPLVYDDTAGTISLNTGGVGSSQLAPTLTGLADSSTLTLTASATETLIQTYTLPTVAYPTTVQLNYTVRVVFFSTYLVQTGCFTTAREGAGVGGAVIGNTETRKQAPTANTVAVETQQTKIVQYAAGATRQVSFTGFKTSATGTNPTTQIREISYLEFHQ